MSGRQSLAEQLAAIRDSAPEEYDPESIGFSFSSNKDLAAGRADYLEVGDSSLRRGQVSELDGKYSGVKASRKDLYNEVAHDYNNEDEDDDDEESGTEDADDDDEQEDSEEGARESAGSETESGEDEESSSSNSEDEVLAKPSKRESQKLGKEDDTRAMLTELKKASSADVEKGKDIKKQLSFWDTLLEARIRLQKCVTSANVLPNPTLFASYSKQADNTRDVQESLEELCELLFSLRESLYDRNDKIQADLSSRKRKRGTSEYLPSALSDLATLYRATQEHERAVISKWSNKISSATSGSSSQQNKFKAIGSQNTLAQIDQTLSQDMARLVERTKVRRGAGGKVVKVVGRDQARAPVQGEKDIDEDVFDDNDFYQALLREIVDATQTSGALNGTTAAYAHFNQVSRKKAANTDPKASKGRKLRFHVHEKLQNFMAPVPLLTWEKEQTDELFRGLLGGNSEEDSQAQEYNFGLESKEGRLRIF